MSRLVSYTVLSMILSTGSFADSEQRCIELGSDCLCSEPFNNDDIYTTDGIKDPSDSISDECNGGAALSVKVAGSPQDARGVSGVSAGLPTVAHVLKITRTMAAPVGLTDTPDEFTDGTFCARYYTSFDSTTWTSEIRGLINDGNNNDLKAPRFVGQGFTTVAITSVADAGGGLIEITTASDHGYIDSDDVRIRGTGFYDTVGTSLAEIGTVTATDKYTIPETFEGTATGISESDIPNPQLQCVWSENGGAPDTNAGTCYTGTSPPFWEVTDSEIRQTGAWQADTPSTFGVADCLDVWCRWEVCFDHNSRGGGDADKLLARQRVYRLSDEATFTWTPALSDGNWHEVWSCGTTDNGCHLFSLSSPDWNNSPPDPDPDGTVQYFSHVMSAKKSPADETFWIGAAEEVEGCPSCTATGTSLTGASLQ